MYKDCREVMALISDGRPPEIWLKDKYQYTSEVKVLSCGGIVPVSSLIYASNTTKDVSSLNCDGMQP